MLSYKEAERTLLNILNDYINEVEEKKIILELIESGSWKAAIYEIDKKTKSYSRRLWTKPIVAGCGIAIASLR